MRYGYLLSKYLQAVDQKQLENQKSPHLDGDTTRSAYGFNNKFKMSEVRTIIIMNIYIPRIIICAHNLYLFA